MVDVYRQPYIPFYLATREFFELVRDRLHPGGVVIVNVGHPEGQDDLEQVLSAHDGRRVRNRRCAIRARTPTRRCSARMRPLSGQRLRRAAASCPPICGRWPRRPPARLAPALEGGEVYTDDKAPVEWLVDKSIVDYAADGE